MPKQGSGGNLVSQAYGPRYTGTIYGGVNLRDQNFELPNRAIVLPCVSPAVPFERDGSAGETHGSTLWFIERPKRCQATGD